MKAFRDAGYWTAGMGKVFHPVPYLNKSDDVAGGSWSAPYFQPPASEDDVQLSTNPCFIVDPEDEYVCVLACKYALCAFVCRCRTLSKVDRPVAAGADSDNDNVAVVSPVDFPPWKWYTIAIAT